MWIFEKYVMNWVYSVQDRIHKISEVDVAVNLGVALYKVTSGGGGTGSHE